MQYDVIIIGSGLGGLSAGAKLAKERKKVLVIEQHHLVGGCATRFKRKCYNFKVSVHELNGINENEHLYKLYQDLNAFENLTFLKIPEFYRWIGAGLDIVIPDSREQMEKLLINKFPHEEVGIKNYFTTIFKIRDELFRMNQSNVIQKILTPFLYRHVVLNEKKSVGEFLDSIINDESLKLMLLGNLIYYHDDPYTMSLIFFSVAQASYFSGSHYIQGGSQELSDHLAGMVTSNGGEVLTHHLVTKILVENGKAIGVEYKQNKKAETEIQQAFASYIVANSAVPNVVNDLLSAEKGKVLKKNIEELYYSPSLLTVYLGFKTALEKYGVKHYSTIVSDESCKTQADVYQNYKSDFTKRSFIFVHYGQVDSKLAPDSKSVGAICTTDYLSDWEQLSDDEYKAKKKVVADTLIKRLNDVYPGIKDAIDYSEVGTAKTVKRYTMNPGGSVYGFAMRPDQAGRNRMPQESSIKNLYLASAWTVPGGGVGAVLGSGYMAANKILQRDMR